MQLFSCCTLLAALAAGLTFCAAHEGSHAGTVDRGYTFIHQGNAADRRHAAGHAFYETVSGQWCSDDSQNSIVDFGALNVSACAIATADDLRCQRTFFHIVNSTGSSTVESCGCVRRAEVCALEGPEAGISGGIYALPNEALFEVMDGTGDGYYCDNVVGTELQLVTEAAAQSLSLCADFVNVEPNCSDIFHFRANANTGETECACVVTGATCVPTQSTGAWAGEGAIGQLQHYFDTIRFGALVNLDFIDDDVTESRRDLFTRRNQSESTILALRAVAASLEAGFEIGTRRRPVELFLISIGDFDDAHEATELLLAQNISFLIGSPNLRQAAQMADAVAAWPTDVVMVAPFATRDMVENRPFVFGFEANITEMWRPVMMTLNASIVALEATATECNLQDEVTTPPRGIAIFYEVESSHLTEMCLEAQTMAEAFGFEVKMFPMNLTENASAMDAVLDGVNGAGRLGNRTVSVAIGCVENFEADLCTQAVDGIDGIAALVMPICAAQRQTINRNGMNWFMTSAATYWAWNTTYADELLGWDMHQHSAAVFRDPSVHSVQAMSAVAILVKAIEDANSVQPDDVRVALEGISYQSLQGTITFDADGLWVVPPLLVQHVGTEVSYPELIIIPGQEVSVGNEALAIEFSFPLPPKFLLPCYIGYNYGFLPGEEDACGICPVPTVPQSEDDRGSFACLLGGSLLRQACQPCRPGDRFVQFDDGSSAGVIPLCVSLANCPYGAALLDVTEDGDAICTNCSAGRYEQYGRCFACPHGRFSETEGQSECKACSAGWFAAEEGQSACESCPGGTASQEASFACLICEPGAYSLPNSSLCLRCLGGSVSTDSGATACSDCAAGSYSVWEADLCQECGPGEYQFLSGQSTCLKIDTSMVDSANKTYGTNRDRFWTRLINGSLSREGCRFTPKACESGEKCVQGTTGEHCSMCIPGYSYRKFSAVEENSPCFECQSKWWNITVTVLAVLGRAMIAVVLASVSVAILSHPSCVVLPLTRLGLMYIAFFGAFGMCYLQVFEERLVGDESSLFPALGTYTAAALLNWVFGTPFLETELWSIKCLLQSDLTDLASDLKQISSVDWYSDANLQNIAALQEEARRVELLYAIIMGVYPLVVATLAYVICLISFLLYLSRWRKFYLDALAFYDDLVEHTFWEAISLRDEEGQLKWKETQWTAYLHEYSYRWILWRPLDHIENYRQGGWLIKLRRFSRESWPIWMATLLLSYQGALHAVMMPLQCITLGSNDQQKIQMATVLNCLDLGEELELNIVGFVGSFFWGIFVPGFVLRLMYRRRHYLTEEFALRRWSMLTDGLEPRCFWWEIYIFFTKFCLDLIIFLTPQYSGRNKNLFLLCWSIAYAFILSVFKPHDDRCHEVLIDLDTRFVKIWVLSCLLLELELLFENEISTVCLLCAIAALHFWFLAFLLRLLFEHVIIALAVSPDFHMLLEANEQRVAAGQRSRRWIVLLQKIVLRIHRWLQRRSPYVSVDPLACWVTVSGSRADVAKPPTMLRGVDVPNGGPSLSEAPTIPSTPRVQEASRLQREQLAKILARAMSHVALASANSTFSVSLLEFVVRASFWEACLHQHGYTRSSNVLQHADHLHHQREATVAMTGAASHMPGAGGASGHAAVNMPEHHEVAQLLEIDHHNPGAFVLAVERPKRRYALWAHLRTVAMQAQEAKEGEEQLPPDNPASLKHQLLEMEVETARTMYEDRAHEVIDCINEKGVIDPEDDYALDPTAARIQNADRAWSADRKALLRQVLGMPVMRHKKTEKEKKEKAAKKEREKQFRPSTRDTRRPSITSNQISAQGPLRKNTHKGLSTTSFYRATLDREAKLELLQDMFRVDTFKHGVGLDDLHVALMDVQKMPANELIAWLDVFEEAWLKHNRVHAYNAGYFSGHLTNVGVLTGPDLQSKEVRRLFQEEKRSRDLEASILSYMDLLPSTDAVVPTMQKSVQVPTLRSTTDQNLQRMPLLWARMAISLAGGFWRFRIAHLTQLANHRVKVRQKLIEDANNKERRLCDQEIASRRDIEASVVALRSDFETLALEIRELPELDD